MSTLDLVIVALYLLLTLGVGLLTRKSASMRDYAIGQRRFPTMLLLVAIFATWFGGESLCAVPDAVYTYGIIYILICLCEVITHLTIAFIIAPRMGPFLGMLTAGDILGHFYGRRAKIITGFLSIKICLLRLAVQIAAIASVFYFFIGTSYIFGACIGIGIIVLYSTFGGIRAVTLTDAVQSVVLLIGLPLVLYFGLEKVGGVSTVYAQLPASHLNFMPPGLSIPKLISLLLIFSIALLDPMLVQRLLMANNPKQIKKAMLATAILDLGIFLLVGAVGLIALVLVPDNSPQPILLNYIHNTLPSGATGIAIACLLAVIMSTADSALNTASISFIHDVIAPLKRKTISDAQELLFTKVTTFFLGLIALIVTLSLTGLVRFETISLRLELWAPVVSVPLLAGILGWKISTRTYFKSILTGATVLVVWKLCNLETHTGLASLLVGMFASLMTMFIFQKQTFSRPSFYAAYRKIINHNLIKLTFFQSTPTFFSHKVLQRLRQNTPPIDQYNPQFLLFGCFTILHYLAPYFFWSELNIGNEAALTLWFIGGLLCGSVLLKDTWSSRLRPFFPLWWHFTLLYCLPCVSFYMALDSQITPFWLINLGLALFLLAALVDWITFMVLLGLGMMLGFGIFTITHGAMALNIFKAKTIFLLGYLSFFAAMVGILFTRNRELEAKHQYDALKSLSDSIANEMRSPLSGLNLGVSGLSRYLPKLLAGYNVAKENQLPVYTISERQLIAAQTLPDALQHTIHKALTTIDMVMTKLKETPDKKDSQIFSITKCIENTLQTYPFMHNEKHLVRWKQGADFKVQANYELFQHVLLNLLKNALYQIHAVNKGNITIWLSQNASTNQIHVKDTACGISKNDLAYIFDKFYTQTRHGTGIGLAFCKMAMEEFGGIITCQSIYKEYAEFVLEFPKVEERS